MIVFNGVTKKFRNITAVSDLSLEIRDGEIMGLLGPNGAGKTTLMLTLATVYRPDSGRITLNGLDVVARADEVRQLIGIAFQDPRFDRLLSVEDILDWHGKMVGLPSDVRSQRIKAILDEMELLDHRKRRTWNLSMGMKKKLENAKVLLQRPRIAVFDEPTAFLDVPSRLKVWGMIKKLREEGTTIILATNMMDEAERLAERVAIMNLGKLVAVDTPLRLKETMKGRDVIDLKIQSYPRELVALCQRIEEVQRVMEVDGGIRIYLSHGRIMLPHILNLILSKDVKVESVSLKEPSLEDVFLHYTGMKLA